MEAPPIADTPKVPKKKKDAQKPITDWLEKPASVKK